jgi:hypothetical protein
MYEDDALVAYRIPDPPAARSDPGPATSATPSPPVSVTTPSIRFGSGWGAAAREGRQATTPSALELSGMVAGPAKLWIASPAGDLPAGTPVAAVTVSTPAGSVRAELLSGQAVGVPIQLAAGSQQLTLTLDPGAAAAVVVAAMDLVTSA